MARGLGHGILALFLVLGLVFASGAQSFAPGLNNLCGSALGTVQTTINGLLAAEAMPVFAYACERGGQSVAIRAGSIDLAEANVSRVNETGYLETVAREVFVKVRGSWTGIGPSDELTNTRNAKSLFIDSTTIKNNLKVKWAIDVAELAPSPDGSRLVKARILTPLGTGQMTEEYVVSSAGQFGWDQYAPSNPYLRNGILSVHHGANGSLVWKRTWCETSTEMQRMLARKYPAQYNITKVDAWHRDCVNTPGGSFSPAVVAHGKIFVGDNSVAAELTTEQYLTGQLNPAFPDLVGLPQSQYGPVMKEDYGISNDNRHYLRTTMGVFDLKTGVLEDVDRFGDSGEGHRSDARGYFDKSAQGFANPNAGMRQPVFWEDPVEGAFLAVGSTILDTLDYNKYTLFDYDDARLTAALRNENIPRRIGRLTVFRVPFDPITGKARLNEHGRVYTQARALFKDDIDPTNTSRRLASDLEAWEHNFGTDGVWSNGIAVDLRRRRAYFSCGNGVERPSYEIKAACLADPKLASVPGGTAYPCRAWYDWKNLTAVPGQSPLDAKQWGLNYRATGQAQVRAIRAMSNRSHEFCAGGLVAFDYLTGVVAFVHQHKGFNLWQSVTFQAQSLVDQSLMPAKNRWAWLAEDNDSDMMGPILIEDGDHLLANSKDGSIVLLDPDTGAERCSAQTGWPVSVGGNNYKGTYVPLAKSYFVSTLRWDVYGQSFGNTAHRTTWDGVSSLPTIDTTVNAQADGINDAVWPTAVFMSKDGGPRRRDLPARSLDVTRMHVPSCGITAVLPLFRPEDVKGSYLPFGTGIGSVNDVVTVAGGFTNKAHFFNAMTGEELATFDHLAYLKNNSVVPADKESLYVNVEPQCAGNRCRTPGGEFFFSGPSEGEFDVMLEVDARP